MSNSKIKSILLNPTLAISAASFMILVGTWVGYKVSPIAALPGILILMAVSVLGVVLSKIIPFKFPAVGWAAVIGVIITIPGFLPGAAKITEFVSRIPFLATATPALAFAGIAVGKDGKDFAKIGWKGILVSLTVMTGTFLGSAVVAEIVMRISGN